MDELGTYRLSDIVPYSKDVYWGLVESYARDFWYMPLAFLLLFSAAVFYKSARASSGILAAAWLWVGLVFHRHYFASINWPAGYYAWPFVAEGLLLLYFGVVKKEFSFRWHWWLTTLFLAACLLPGPVATATFFWLAASASGRVRNLLLVIPGLWVAISLLTWLGVR